jgi:hypothetical protein
MQGRECHHCKQWVPAGAAHDCWTTTEAALTQDLSEDLMEAWERLRETAVEFGDQRIYASGRCIMFSRKTCYFFVRPKRNVLEVCVFLGRRVAAPQIRRADASSRTKIYHILHVRHRDEVEAPITDWLREAYEASDALSGRRPATKRAGRAGGAGKAGGRAKGQGQKADKALRAAGTKGRKKTRLSKSPPAKK